MHKITPFFIALAPIAITAGPGITIEIDVFIPHPADEKSSTDNLCDKDSECSNNDRVSCENQKE